MRVSRSRLLILLVAAIGAAWLAYAVVRHGRAVFPDAHGPTEATPIKAAVPTRLSDFGGGGPHRLAVLVTDPDSGWLGLARGLRAHGIPFTMTTSVAEALRHKVVFAYPIISGAALHRPDFDALRKHVAEGGSLLSFDVEGGGLADLFGVAGAPAPTRAEAVRWTDPAIPPEDRETRVSRRGTEARLGTVGYRPTTAAVLGRYDTGEAAVTCRRSAGVACAMGVDLGALTARAMNGREEAVGRSYVNGYEPSVDVLYRWLARFYVAGEPMPWLVDTAPAGKDVTILLSHDIDYTEAVKSAAVYAKTLRGDGADATFFMQTKYVRDFNDDVFFNPGTLPDVASVLRDGMEVGSHSVSHARTFKAFPMGDGAERYPDYRPFVKSRTDARGTVLGELRVSRYLLQHLAGADVTSFRAGYLSNPFALPQALAAAGYRYDSSITANSCLTHLPFQLTRDRADTALEPVYEFPVTIEDEASPPMIARLGAANAAIANIARDHGLAVILVHPDTRTRKLEFERRIVAAWKGRAWLPSMRTFGDWWRARDEADVDVDASPAGGWRLSLHASPALHGLVVHLPKAKGERLSLPSDVRRDDQVTIVTR